MRSRFGFVIATGLILTTGSVQVARSQTAGSADSVRSKVQAQQAYVRALSKGQKASNGQHIVSWGLDSSLTANNRDSAQATLKPADKTFYEQMKKNLNSGGWVDLADNQEPKENPPLKRQLEVAFDNFLAPLKASNYSGAADQWLNSNGGPAATKREQMRALLTVMAKAGGKLKTAATKAGVTDEPEQLQLPGGAQVAANPGDRPAPGGMTMLDVRSGTAGATAGTSVPNPSTPGGPGAPGATVASTGGMPPSPSKGGGAAGGPAAGGETAFTGPEATAGVSPGPAGASNIVVNLRDPNSIRAAIVAIQSVQSQMAFGGGGGVTAFSGAGGYGPNGGSYRVPTGGAYNPYNPYSPDKGPYAVRGAGPGGYGGGPGQYYGGGYGGGPGQYNGGGYRTGQYNPGGYYPGQYRPGGGYYPGQYYTAGSSPGGAYDPRGGYSPGGRFYSGEYRRPGGYSTGQYQPYGGGYTGGGYGVGGYYPGQFPGGSSPNRGYYSGGYSAGQYQPYASSATAGYSPSSVRAVGGYNPGGYSTGQFGVRGYYPGQYPGGGGYATGQYIGSMSVPSGGSYAFGPPSPMKGGGMMSSTPPQVFRAMGGRTGSVAYNGPAEGSTSPLDSDSSH